MNGIALATHGRVAALAFLAAALMSSCAATTEEPDEGVELASVCPTDMKLHCFKRTAKRQDCYCVDPEDFRRLMEEIGPKGVLERQRDRWD